MNVPDDFHDDGAGLLAAGGGEGENLLRLLLGEEGIEGARRVGRIRRRLLDKREVDRGVVDADGGDGIEAGAANRDRGATLKRL